MTLELEEAIIHAEEVAEEKEKEAYEIVAWIGDYDNLYYNSCRECAKEHRQLAEWLRELKAYRNAITEMKKWINSNNRGNADYFIVDKIEEIIKGCEVE